MAEYDHLHHGKFFIITTKTSHADILSDVAWFTHPLQLYLPLSFYKNHEESNNYLARRRVTAAAAAAEFGTYRRHSLYPKSSGERDPYERKAGDVDDIMSHHSYQHRTLVTLLRDRNLIQEDERVPEDGLFSLDHDNDGDKQPFERVPIPRETRVGALPGEDDDHEHGEAFGFGNMNSSTDPHYGLGQGGGAHYRSQSHPGPEGLGGPGRMPASKRTSDHSEKFLAGQLPSAVSVFLFGLLCAKLFCHQLMQM